MLAHTATQRCSPRGFELPFRGEQGSGSEDEEAGQGITESTDIELLKRCITLTNENNLIKQQLNSQQALIQQLQQDLQASQLRQQQICSEIELHRSPASASQPMVTPSPPAPWVRDIERERQEIQLQQSLLDKKYQQLERDRAQLRAQQKKFQNQLRQQLRRRDTEQTVTVLHN